MRLHSRLPPLLAAAVAPQVQGRLWQQRELHEGRETGLVPPVVICVSEPCLFCPLLRVEPKKVGGYERWGDPGKLLVVSDPAGRVSAVLGVCR